MTTLCTICRRHNYFKAPEEIHRSRLKWLLMQKVNFFFITYSGSFKRYKENKFSTVEIIMVILRWYGMGKL